MAIEIRLIGGVEGDSVYIGDIRVGGNKPWGGGSILQEWNTSVSDILYALNNVYNPAHQPQKTKKGEIEILLKNIEGSHEN